MKKVKITNDIERCFYLFQLLGLQYFSLSNLKENRSSIKYRIYFIFMLILITSQQIFGISMMRYNDNDDKNTVKGMINIFVDYGIFGLFFVVTILTLIFAYQSSCLQKNFFINLEEIGKEFLMKLNQKIDYKPIVKKLLIQEGVSTIIFVSFFLTFAFLELKIDLELGLYFFSATLSLLIVCHVPSLMSIYADLISTNLIVLLKCLIDTLAIINKPVLADTDKSVVTIVKPRTTIFPENILLDRLVSLKFIYLSIWEASDFVNSSMGNQILIFISFLVLHFIIGGYKIFLSVMGDKVAQDIEITIILVILEIIVILSLVHYCEKPEKSVSFWIDFY